MREIQVLVNLQVDSDGLSMSQAEDAAVRAVSDAMKFAEDGWNASIGVIDVMIATQADVSKYI